MSLINICLGRSKAFKFKIPYSKSEIILIGIVNSNRARMTIFSTGAHAKRNVLFPKSILALYLLRKSCPKILSYGTLVYSVGIT